MDAPSAEPETPQRHGVSWRSVALPSEHGGWSLTAEPALLGLLVAWSWPGLALGLAAMLAFVARTPVKLVLLDRWRGRWLARTGLAARIATLEVAVLVVLAVAAALLADGGFWLPFVVAAPLVGLELWYDMRSRGRRLIPELAGSVGIGSVATAIALADGASDRLAWGLWVVIGVRAFAAIPYVRCQILRTHNRPGPNWHSDVVQGVAGVAIVVAWAADLVTVAAVIAIIVVALFNVAAVRTPPRPAKVIGIEQMVLGLAVIAATLAGIHTL